MELAIVTGAAALLSYLVCGIPFGYLIAARMAGVDVRKEGSGNIGMTNVARTTGAKAAAATFVCDVGKGLVSMLISRTLIAEVAFAGDAGMLAMGAAFDWCLAWVYCACVLGHIFSPYLGFRGGKGISVGFGAALGLHWPMGVGLLAIFLILVLPTRYVSLGSVVAAISLPLQGLFWHLSLTALIPVVVASVVVVWSHRENIGRLLGGCERRFTLHSEKGGDR